MASLKDQLDQAGYDTSTLDEGAVVKQLSDAGYDTSSFTPSNPSIMDRVKGAGSAIMNASKKVGNMVEGGAAGIADIDANLIPKMANAVIPFSHFKTEPFLPAVQQAGQDVTNVENDVAPETAAGKAGKFVGSFVTPNQIAAQAVGGAIAKPITAGLSKVAAPIVNGLVNNFPKISSMLGVAPEALTRLVDNPEAVSAAQDAPGMAQDAGSFLKGVSKKGMASAKAATEALSTKAEVEGAGDVAQKTLGKLTTDKTANEAAKDKLSEIVTSLQRKPTEANVGQAVEDLDDLIKYNSQSAPDWSNQLRTVRQQLSNSLKAQNAAYKEGMEAAAATREPLKTLSQNLGVKNGLPNDWTIKALSKLNNPDALATQRALSTLPGGAQLASNASNAVAKAALQKSLLGKAALKVIPNASAVTSGAIQALPAAGNAVYQGLMQ